MSITPITRKIFSNLCKFKEKAIHKIHPERHKYVLKAKIGKCKVSTLRNFGGSIPEGADTYTMVRIGKRDDENYSKEITTFFEGNQILRRYINDCGKIIEKRYTEERIHFLGTVKILKTVRTSCLNAKQKMELQKFERINLEEKTYTKDKRYKLKRDENIYNGSRITAKLKTFDNMYIDKPVKHDIKLLIRLDSDGIPHIIKKYIQKDFKSPGNDEFLPFRFIFDFRKQRLAFTRYYLKKYNLQKMGIKVYDKKFLDDFRRGTFNPETGVIEYDADWASTLVAAAHEARHAYQYALIGRLFGGDDYYLSKARKLLGKIRKSSELRKARKFLRALNQYPSEADIMRNHSLYENNYLEVDARKAARQAKKEYAKGKRILESIIGDFD